MGITRGPASEGCCADFRAHSESYHCPAAATVANITLLNTLNNPLYAGLGPFPEWVCIRAPKWQSHRYVA